MAHYGRNRYSYSSRRRRSDNTALLRALVIIMPLLILLVLGLGIFFAYQQYVKDNPEADYPQSQSEDRLYDEGEADLLVSVIDEDNQLTADYVPELTQVDGVQVNTLAVSELDRMRSAASTDGCTVRLISGYVSYDEQKALNQDEQERLQRELEYTPVRAEAEAKKTVPQAGCSERQTGLLLEFGSDGTEDFTQSLEYQWLLRNANDYGYIQRYPQTDADVQSKALFRFVGVENAAKMRSFGMTLDEYNAYIG